MAYIPFTDKEKTFANSVDLAVFLRMRGEKLECIGREHKLIYYDGSGKHDSIIIHGSTCNSSNTLIGTAGADSLTGTSNIDYIYGEAGDDKLYGGNRNDILDGGESRRRRKQRLS